MTLEPIFFGSAKVNKYGPSPVNNQSNDIRTIVLIRPDPGEPRSNNTRKHMVQDMQQVCTSVARNSSSSSILIQVPPQNLGIT